VTAEKAVEVPMTDRELATRMLVVAAVQDRLKAIDQELRAQAKSRLTVGDRVTGFLDPEDPKGSKLGTVTMTEGSEYVAVKDSAAFLAWVIENHPDEVESNPTVRPAFSKAVTESVKRDGGWIDPESGELVEVPGVEKDVGDPKPMVRKTGDAGKLVAAALAAGKLRELTS
jgi:hypothetical protein